MRQQKDLQYWETNRTYIDGNTARELAMQAEQRKEQIHQEYVEWQEEEQEQRKRQRQVRAAAQKNRDRALSISPGYVLFIAVTMAVMGAVFACYLQLQSDLNKNVRSVAALESELLDLKDDNDAVQKKISNSIDMENVRQQAMDELGMVYPQEDQIEYFEVENDDYMNQYEDIPER
ncbi:MAG: hypothetical protein HFH36_06300 [Lachnospiraceae bacterium]|nr:hypothetical protein [Lachnospiraceae bacterium]